MLTECFSQETFGSITKVLRVRFHAQYCFKINSENTKNTTFGFFFNHLTIRDGGESSS